MKLIDLGWCIGRYENVNQVKLQIVSPSFSEDDTGFEPAQDITIHGIEQLKKLRDALDTILKED